jgi:septum formation inhibitor MinC
LWAFKLPVFLISLWVSKINKIKRDKQRALEEIRSAKLLAERARQEAEEEEDMRIELVEERARAKENKRRRLARKAKKEAEAQAKAIIVSKIIKTKTTKLAKETLVKKLDSMD